MKEPRFPATPGQVFSYFRTLPEMSELVRLCYYDDVTDAADRFVISDEFAEVEGFVRSQGKYAPGRVLDLGGGNGMASLAWEKRGYQSILLEPDPDEIVGYGAILPLIQEKKSRIQIVSALGEKLPFSDGEFDMVYARQVLHHIPDLKALTHEIYRVLKPGGLLIATREHILSRREDLAIFQQSHLVHKYTGGENAYLLNEYVDAIRNARFHDVQVLNNWESPINYYPITKEQASIIISHSIQKYVHHTIARQLTSVAPLRRLLAGIRAQIDDTPGRMYSFFARK